MGTITRGAKLGGGTNYNTGQIIDPSEVNADENTVYTEINGGLDDANIETATIPGAKSLRFTELSGDPASPAANDVLIYSKDDGGVTRIYTKDSAGTVTLIAAAAQGGAKNVILPMSGAILPDASGTGNNAPAPVREISSATQTTNTPKVTQSAWDFDASTDEHLLWAFMVPDDYASGGTLRLTWKAVTATAGDTIWKGSIVPTVNSSTDDDALAFNTVAVSAASTAPGTQGQTVATTIVLTVTNVAADRKVVLFLGRDADAAGDTMTGDARLVSARFEYS